MAEEADCCRCSVDDVFVIVSVLDLITFEVEDVREAPAPPSIGRNIRGTSEDLSLLSLLSQMPYP